MPPAHKFGLELILKRGRQEGPAQRNCLIDVQLVEVDGFNIAWILVGADNKATACRHRRTSKTDC